MYFHLIGIKEKNGDKFDLNFLLQGGDEDFIRKFLANRGVVIVSLTEYKEDPLSFGNIIVNLNYNGSNIQLITQGEDLSESTLFIVSMGLIPGTINFVDKPIPEDQVKDIINTALSKVKEEDKKIKEQAEIEELKEKKKYEEAGIKEGLKIINSNIDRIEQVIKAGQGVLGGGEIKKLEEYCNEMKKIRLGTNFNKMAALVLDAHSLLINAENQVIEANSENKFLIDKNSIVTNIDVLKEYFDFSRISEKSVLQPAGLKTSEMLTNAMGKNSILLSLLRRDIIHTFENSSFGELFDIVINLIEYVILLAIITITLSWLVGPLFGFDSFSLYLLPAMGRLGLLIYLLNNVELKGTISKIVGFVVLILIYRKGLVLLLNTFAL